MEFPTPDDPKRAPAWENYVVAQAVQASLGQIPEHALAVGVEIAGPEVTLRFQLTDVTEEDEEDMAGIAMELEGLLGCDVHVNVAHTVLHQRQVVPVTTTARYVFLSRVPRQ